MSQSTVTEKRTVITSSSGGSGYDSLEDIPYKASFGSRSSNIMSRSSLPLRSSTGGTQVTRVVEYGYGSHLGGGMGPGGYSNVSNSGVTSVKSSREREKKDLQDLNERFASYIEKVRFLEAQNRKLGSELDELRSKWGKETSQIKQMYEAELAEARRLIDDLSKDKAALEIKTSSLQEQFGDMQRQLDEAKKYRQTDRDTINKLNQQLADYESEINMLRRSIESLETERSRDKATINRQQQEIDKLRIDLNNETLAHLDAENRRQTLEEEMEFMKKVHEQELKELAALAYRDTTAENREFWKSELGQAIRDIQQEYDAKVEQLRGDMEGFYNLKIQEYRTGATKQNMEVTHIREENKKLTKQMSDLRGKLADLEARNAQLEKQYQDALRELETKETDHMMETTQLKEEIIKLRAEMEGILTELQTLMDAKLSLELEIAAYRKLLEGEENRVDWRSRASLIMYRDAFKPKSDRSEQESTREKEPENFIEAKIEKTVSRQPDQREPSPDTDAASSITMSDNEMSQKGDEGDLELEDQSSGDKGLGAQEAGSKAVENLDHSGVGTFSGSVESIKSSVHEHVVKVKEEIQKLETQKAALDEIDSKENGHENDIETDKVENKKSIQDESENKIELEKSAISPVDEIIQTKTSSIVESGIDKDVQSSQTKEKPESFSKHENETNIGDSYMAKDFDQSDVNLDLAKSISSEATSEKTDATKDIHTSEIKDPELVENKVTTIPEKDIQENTMALTKTSLDEEMIVEKSIILENEQKSPTKSIEKVETQVLAGSEADILTEKMTTPKDDFDQKVVVEKNETLESHIKSSETDKKEVITETKQAILPETISPTKGGIDENQKVKDEHPDIVENEIEVQIDDSKSDGEQAIAESKPDTIPEEITSTKYDINQKGTDDTSTALEKENKDQMTSSDIVDKQIHADTKEDLVPEKLESTKNGDGNKVDLDADENKDIILSKTASGSEHPSDEDKTLPIENDNVVTREKTAHKKDTLSEEISITSHLDDKSIVDHIREDNVRENSTINDEEKPAPLVHETESVVIQTKESPIPVSIESTSTDAKQIPDQKVSAITVNHIKDADNSTSSESFLKETDIENENISTDADKPQQLTDTIEKSTKSELEIVSDINRIEHTQIGTQGSEFVTNGKTDSDLKRINEENKESYSKEIEDTNIQSCIEQDKEQYTSKIDESEGHTMEAYSVLENEHSVTELSSEDGAKESKSKSTDKNVEIKNERDTSLTIDTIEKNATREVITLKEKTDSKIKTHEETPPQTGSNVKLNGEQMGEKDLSSTIKKPETEAVEQKENSEVSASSSTATTTLATSAVNLASISQKNESKIESVKTETIKETVSTKSEVSETVLAHGESEKNEFISEKTIVSDKIDSKFELTEKTEDKILESVVQSKMIEKSQDSARLEMSPTKELPDSFPEVKKEESHHSSTALDLKETGISTKVSPESDKLPTAKALPESHSSEQIEDDKTPDEEEQNVNSNSKLSSDPSDLKEKSPDRTKIEETMTVLSTADVQHVESTSKSEALLAENTKECLNEENKSGDSYKVAHESEKDNVNQTIHIKENDIMTQSFISENGFLTNGDIKEADDKPTSTDATPDEADKSTSKEEVTKTKDDNADYDGVPDKPSEPLQMHDAVLQEKIESLLLNGQDEQSTYRQPENVIEATPPTNKPDSQVSMKMMRGEVSAKTTYQRTSTGPIAISEVEPNAKYITLENTSSGPNRKDVNLDGWRLRRIVDGDKEYCYNFRNFTLKPGKKVKIMARGSASEAGLNDLVFREENSWGVGQQVTTSLCNEKEEEKASHIQRTNYN